VTELPEPDDERDRVTAPGHRLDGLRCTVYAQRQPDATWTLFGVPYRCRLAPTDHGRGPGVRLTPQPQTFTDWHPVILVAVHDEHRGDDGVGEAVW
jgi:hypothetical protein